MSIETDGSQSAASESTSNYSAVDPGVSSETWFTDDDLTTKSESETSDDESSETDNVGETEEHDNSSAGDDAADELSDELIDRAFALGYTVDDLKAVNDAKSLEQEISRVERLNARLSQGAKKPPEEKPKETAPESDEAEKEPDWESMIEAGHDPEVIALQKRTWQRAQQAEARANQLFQAEQNRAMEAQVKRFDDTLSSMEGFKDLFGSGSKAELDKSAPSQAQNRQKVFTEMNIIRRGYEAANVPVPSEEKLIEKAVFSLFHQHVTRQAREALKKDIRKAGEQSLSRARTTKADDAAGPDKALELERQFRKRFKV